MKRNFLTVIKRFYHPGLTGENKLCLPLCEKNNISKYYEPVWGNEIQKEQLNKNIHVYKTDNINYYSKKVSSFYDNDTIFIPTSHNTPIRTALRSCRNLDSEKFIKKIDNEIIDAKGIFINTQKNRENIFNLLNYCENDKEKDIVKTAIYGIISNYGDSIYIANDYLNIGKFNIISNYPDKVSQREIERCRIIAYSLMFGKYPIILDNEYDFEGEANIKFIPAIIRQNNQDYQVCITYNSTRSTTKCIQNINKYLEKLRLPLLMNINFKTKKGMEKYFYHLDCLLNFYADEEYQYFNSVNNFWNNYKKNGLVVIEKNGEDDLLILKKLFEKIIFVDMNDDLLAANMIMKKNGIVGSSSLQNKTDFENINNTFLFKHPSLGGGGAHKCCSNVINQDKEIKLEDFILFLKNYDIKYDESLIRGVEEEIERLKNIHLL